MAAKKRYTLGQSSPTFFVAQETSAKVGQYGNNMKYIKYGTHKYAYQYTHSYLYIFLCFIHDNKMFWEELTAYFP
jgi:hypothetical protein